MALIPARSFLASAAVVLMLAATPAVAGDLESADLLILAVEIDRQHAADSISAYETGGSVYLPLGALAEILGFAITVDPSAGTASGFFISQERTFTIDAAAATAEILGARVPLEPGAIQAMPDDLYVRMDLWEAWFPLKVGVHRGAAVLAIHPLEPLPAQERMRRLRRGGRAKGAEEEAYPIFEPYSLWARPGIRQQFRARATNSAGVATAEPIVYSSTSAAGMLLNSDYRIFIAADSESRHFESRVTVGRRAPEATLLGPLRARAWELGDIHSSGFDLISGPTSGLGLSITNRDSSLFGSRAGSRTLRGDAPPGWDVELYRENELLGFLVVGDDGIWEFRDVPLRVGRNAFRVVVNGPHGEREEENISMESSAAFLPAGKVAYQIVTIAPDEQTRDGDLHLAQLRFGLGGGAVGEVVWAGGEGRRQVARGGLSASFAGLVGEVLYATEPTGEGAAFSANLQRRGPRFGYFLGHRQYGAGYESGGVGPEQRSASTLRIDWSAQRGGRTMPLSFSLTRETERDGEARTAARIAASARRGTMHVSADLGGGWSDGGSTIADGRLFVSRPVGTWTVRAGARYGLAPELEVSQLQLRGERFRADGSSLVLGVTQTAEGDPRVSGGIRKSIGGVGLELTASADEHLVSADVGVSFGFIPVGNSWTLRPQTLVDDDGMLRVELFVDRDRDGERDSGEPPVAGATVSVDGRPSAASTDADGVIVLAGLPTRRYVALTVQPRDLPDPLMVPAVEGIRVRARETVPTAIPLPILFTAEIYGHVFSETGEPAAGVELILRKGDGAIVQRSEFDGFFQWTRLAPGDYSIEISHRGSTRRVPVSIGEGDVVDDLQIILGE